MSKKEELEKLKKKMLSDDSLPLKKGATNLVFGVGSADTKIFFIGEGPGFYEDQQAEPFVGRSGKLLDRGLLAIKLSREKVFITNIVHHRPPENRDPLPEEIEAYGKYLDKIIEIINPKIIVTLGRFSMNKFIPNSRITAIHGKAHVVEWNGKFITVVPMFHPAAALRGTEVMNMFKADFLALPEILSKANKQEIKQMELI